MEQILDLPSTGQRTLNYAGFWIRFAAVFIDGIIFSVFFYGLLFALGGFMDPTAIMVSYAFALFGGIAYFVGMEASSKQATLGKMAVGIKVGDEFGNRISVGKALGRYFSKIISGLILYIGYMMAGWDAKKQALHDKIAGTYVFYSK
jgi:uncharacterized RDD family membrane protein YckC